MPLLEFLIQIKIDFTNTNLLKRRTSPVEQETEAKRQKRSAKTNARKSAKQTRDRFQRKMKEVMKLLSKGKFTKDMKKEGNTICLQDINKTCQMVARFHSKTMCFGL